MVLLSIILYTTLVMIIDSPEGYQDEDGFHYGKRNDYDKKISIDFL